MFRQKIKDFTRKIHKYVENRQLMNEIMETTITRQKYLQYLIQLNEIYKSIENNKVFVETELDIKFQEKCQEDINVLSENNKEYTNLLEITNIYCNYLKQISNKDVIMAHAYVRYMGDFYGGKIIKTKLHKDFPKNVYNVKENKTIIIDYIENKIENKEYFLSELHHAFMSYISIFESIK